MSPLNQQKKALVIGGGFGGISAATYLAKAGYQVKVLEKNSWLGGRAQVFEKAGYRFDMGPSWYLLPKVFDDWFQDFGESRAEYYKVLSMPTQYKAYFEKTEYTIPNNRDQVAEIFESIETGAGKKFFVYLEQCKKLYTTALEKFIYRNYNSVFDLLSLDIIKEVFAVKLFNSYKQVVRSTFKSPQIQAMLEYPTVFLGSNAKNLPAIYTLMNWVDFGVGALYAEGGYSGVTSAMVSVAKKNKVEFLTNHPVDSFVVKNGKVVSVKAKGADFEADLVVANADYHFVDQVLTPESYRVMSEGSWDKKKLAPSCLNFYIAFKEKLPQLEAHTFFFDAPWDENFASVYETKQLHKQPLFYVHVPSKVDPHVAPKNCETVFVLIPVASGLEISEKTEQDYFEKVMKRMAHKFNMSDKELKSKISFKKTYTVSDFVEDYNAYKGTAFGLGQTLFQTAAFRPPNRNPHLSNLYYAGQYSIPGTGVSMAVIGGKVVVERIIIEQGYGS